MDARPTVGRAAESIAATVAATAAAALLACGVLGAAGCSADGDGAQGGAGQTSDPATFSTPASASSQEARVPTGEVTVVAREDGSGTRASFVAAFGLQGQDRSGQSVDLTTVDAVVVNTTAAVMATVAQDPAAIGYVSVGSLNDTVKAVAVDGVLPSVETVRDGSYPACRDLGVATQGELSTQARDFLDFVLSADGQALIEAAGYVPEYDDAAPYTPSDLQGKVVVTGSSSVEPVMEKLAEAYEALNPNVNVEVNLSDSSTGVAMATDMVCDLGMVSRALEAGELAEGAELTVVARDGVAVVVNPASSVENLTSDQVRALFEGTAATWEDALAVSGDVPAAQDASGATLASA